ncbi:unnamed protein product, partial [Mesorhabditis belari]|uniref:C2H2-type domain-containing protein n=1 Tax=Mesorhabditis belari TaxID=2138241 RepID=A0AAF3EV33_9BILA
MTIADKQSLSTMRECEDDVENENPEEHQEAQEKVPPKASYSAPGGFTLYLVEMFNLFHKDSTLSEKLSQLAEANGYVHSMNEDGSLSRVRLLRHYYNLLDVEKRNQFELQARENISRQRHLHRHPKRRRRESEDPEEPLFQPDLQKVESEARRNTYSEITFSTETEHRLTLAKKAMENRGCPLCVFSFAEGEKMLMFPQFSIPHLLQHSHATLYGCHFCLQAYASFVSLNTHKCDRFEVWKNEERHYSKYQMEAAQVFLACSDCGAHVYCDPIDLQQSMSFIEKHQITRLVPLVVYFADEKINENGNISFKYTPSYAREFFVSCEKCKITSFATGEHADIHFSDPTKHPEIRISECGKCKTSLPHRTSYRKHLLSCYFHDNVSKNSILVADYLSTTATITGDKDGFRVGMNSGLSVNASIQERAPPAIEFVNGQQSLAVERVKAKNKRARARQDTPSTSMASQPELGHEEIAEEPHSLDVWIKSDAQKSFIRKTIGNTDPELAVDLRIQRKRRKSTALNDDDIKNVQNQKSVLYNVSIKNHLARYEETVFLTKKSYDPTSIVTDPLDKVHLCLVCYHFVLGEKGFLKHMKTCQPGVDPFETITVSTLRSRGLRYINQSPFHCCECDFFGCSLLSLRVHLATKHQIGTHSLLQDETHVAEMTVSERFNKELNLVNGFLPRRVMDRAAPALDAIIASQVEKIVLSDSDVEDTVGIEDLDQLTTAPLSSSPQVVVDGTSMDVETERSIVKKQNVTNDVLAKTTTPPIKNHQEKDDLLCLLCSARIMGGVENLEKHYSSHRESAWNTCHLCPPSNQRHFAKLDLLLYHILESHCRVPEVTIENRNEKVTCIFCPALCNYSGIVSHILYYCSEVPCCLLCGQENIAPDRSKWIINHRQLKHDAPCGKICQNRFICNHCDITMRALTQAERHRCPPKDKPKPTTYYRCECGEIDVFSQKQFMNHFLMIHFDTNAQCHLCHTQLVTSQHAELHRLVDILEKHTDGQRRIVVLDERLMENVRLGPDFKWCSLQELNQMIPKALLDQHQQRQTLEIEKRKREEQVKRQVQQATEQILQSTRNLPESQRKTSTNEKRMMSTVAEPVLPQNRTITPPSTSQISLLRSSHSGSPFKHPETVTTQRPTQILIPIDFPPPPSVIFMGVVHADTVPINIEPPPSVQCLSDPVFLPTRTVAAAARVENSSTVTIWDQPPPSVQCLSDPVFLPTRTVAAAARVENSSTVTIWDQPPPSVQCLSDPVFLPTRTVAAAARVENSSTVTICDHPTTSRDDSSPQLVATVREEIAQKGANVQSSIPDDGEDDIIFVDSTETNKPEERANFVQEEDEECMIEDIVPISSSEVKGGRERKIQCPKCSKKFFTKGSCEVHMNHDHRVDKGSETTVKGTYGLPHDERKRFYICVMCSIIYDDPMFFRKHMGETHGNCPPIVCPLCSCAGFNQKSSEAHWKLHERYAAASGVPNMCVEHDFVFGKDIELMFHANLMHDAKLLFFCKKCFLASLDGSVIVLHLKICKAAKRPNETFPPSINLEGEQALGVISVNTVNYQPADENAWIKILASPNPPSTAIPSQCNHKTLLADKYPFVLCSDRNCNTWYIQQAYTGTFEDQTEKVEALMARGRTIIQNPWSILNRVGMRNPQNLPFYVRLKAAQGESTMRVPLQPPTAAQGLQTHRLERQQCQREFTPSSSGFSSCQSLSTPLPPQNRQVQPPTVRIQQVQTLQTPCAKIVIPKSNFETTVKEPEYPYYEFILGNKWQKKRDGLHCVVCGFQTRNMFHVSDDTYQLWRNYIKKFCDECVEAEKTQKRQIQLMFELRWKLMGEDGRKRYACYCHATPPGLFPAATISPKSQENFDLALSTCLVCGSLKKRQLMPLPGVEALNWRAFFMVALVNEHHLDPDTFRWNVAMSPLAMFCPAHVTMKMHEEMGLLARKQQQKAAYEAQAGPSNQSREQPQRPQVAQQRFAVYVPQQQVPPQPRPQQLQPPRAHRYPNFATSSRAFPAVTPAPPSPVNAPITSTPNVMNPHLMNMVAMNQRSTQMAAQMQLMGQPHSSHIFGMPHPHPPFHPFPMGIPPGMAQVQGLIPDQRISAVHGIPPPDIPIRTRPIMTPNFSNLLPQQGQRPQQNNPLQKQPQGAYPTTPTGGYAERIPSGEMQPQRMPLQPGPSRMPENGVLPSKPAQAQPQQAVRVICELCKMEVKTDADQMFHKMIHRTKNKYFCLECNKPVSGNEEQDLVQHMLEHTNNTSHFELSCPFPACLETNLNSSLSLKIHLITVHAKQLPHQALCGMKFAANEAIPTHDNEHKRNGDDRCCRLCLTINCWAKVETGIPNYTHELIHGIIRILRCRICGEEMKGPNQNKALLRHWVNKHTARSSNAPNSTCTGCQKSVSLGESEAHLKEHMAFMVSASTRGRNNAPMLIVKTCNKMARLLGIQEANSDPNQVFYEDE